MFNFNTVFSDELAAVIILQLGGCNSVEGQLMFTHGQLMFNFSALYPFIIFTLNICTVFSYFVTTAGS